MGTLRQRVEEAFQTGYDAGDLDRYADNFTPGCEIIGMGMTMGRDEFRGLLAGFAAAFSESRHTVVDAVESGDRIVSEIVWTARHTGTLASPAGEVPATGNEVNWRMCMVDRFEGDRIASRHIYLDQQELMTQLGAVPAGATS